jgi:UDP-N-acetylglucosamine 2-epimerase (non-hydrolysing)
MIDTLMRLLPRTGTNGLPEKPYALVTLHRPSNADDSAELARILSVLNEIASDIQTIFPVHPRTARMIGGFQINHILRIFN